MANRSDGLEYWAILEAAWQGGHVYPSRWFDRDGLRVRTDHLLAAIGRPHVTPTGLAKRVMACINRGWLQEMGADRRLRCTPEGRFVGGLLQPWQGANGHHLLLHSSGWDPPAAGGQGSPRLLDGNDDAGVNDDGQGEG
jgi:hypothetical protein